MIFKRAGLGEGMAGGYPTAAGVTVGRLAEPKIPIIREHIVGTFNACPGHCIAHIDRNRSRQIEIAVDFYVCRRVGRRACGGLATVA